MRSKRFLLHDVEVDLHRRRVSCTRCPAQASGAPDRDWLYRALEHLDLLPCARAELDQQGVPRPIQE